MFPGLPLVRSVLVYSLDGAARPVVTKPRQNLLCLEKQLIPWESSQEFKYIDLSNSKWTFVWSIL